MTLYDFFIEPFTLIYVQRAVFVGVFIAISTAILGSFILLRNWAMIGISLSNSIIPGVIIANASFIAMPIGAIISGMLCTYLTNYVINNSRIKPDTAMGLTYAGFFAGGVVLISFLKVKEHVFHILFGDILGILPNDLYQALIVSVLVIIIVSLNFKNYTLYAFDQIQSRLSGMNYRLLDVSFLVLLTLTVISSMQAVGILLTIAMLIASPLSASLLFKRLHVIVIFACIFSILTTVLGIMLSYHIDAGSGPAIVTLQAILFVISLVIHQVRNKIIVSRIIEKNLKEQKEQKTMVN